jgi:transposase
MVAIDGSKFKAVNTRDKNYTPGAIQRRIEQVDCRATIKVRTPDNQGEKMFCRSRRREGGARPEARAAEKLA